MNASANKAQRKATQGMLKMVLVALGAFGLSFSLIPLYRVACEKVLGIRLEKTAAQGDAATVKPGDGRVVTVQFDGGVNSKLPWRFAPDQMTMKVHPGELYRATYTATNASQRAIVGSAVPSLAPARASGYFNKTECFCFTSQTLQADETRQMPVRFIIDPNLPADVETVTLSYTFFKNDVLTAKLAGAPAASHSAP